MRAGLAAAILVPLLAGCTSELHSGVHGTAILGPTCPVERNPPDPQCAPKAYDGELAMVASNGRVVATVHTDASGAFNVTLAPGTYHVASPEGQSLPRCTSDDFAVAAGRYVSIV